MNVNQRRLQNFGCRPNSSSGFSSKTSKYSNIPAASILALLDFVSASYVLQPSQPRRFGAGREAMKI